MPVRDSSSEAFPKLHHLSLETTFCGTEHTLSTPEAPINQFLGIQYATIPARFRQSHLCTAASYPPTTDASKHGPICPQLRKTRSPEEMLFGIPQDEIPLQHLEQDEFECLNLNIISPAGVTPHSRIPVMLWVHGGGDRGSGSEWFYDGGAIVRKSMLSNKPIIFITFNFRIGLLGFAASPIIRDDNKAAGEDGTGNYGLRDQRKAMEWLHHNICEFGGDPSNITLIGSGSGAADIVSHLLSKSNASKPLFARSIIQSPIFEPTLPDVSSAGWHLSRVMSALQVSCIDKFRKIEVQKLFGLGQTLRAIDDGVWFREGWQSWFTPKETVHAHHYHRESTPSIPHPTFSVQPIIIGDCASDSLLWSHPISLWTSSGVVRRLKAICQSLSKTSNILRAYDINSYTSDEEIMERVLELVDDARISWPTHVLAESIRREAEERGDTQKVWRYVFDQEGPARGVPHHCADLMYLFDWKPSSLTASSSEGEHGYGGFYDGPYDVDDDEDEREKAVVSHAPPSLGSMSFEAALAAAAEAAAAAAATSKIDPHALAHSIVTSGGHSASLSVPCPTHSQPLPTSLALVDDAEWLTSTVDEYAYTRVRDTMQERWLAFAYGESPWTPWEHNRDVKHHHHGTNLQNSHHRHVSHRYNDPQEEKVFVFGPEGEAGERSTAIFEGRRRHAVWSEVLEPLGFNLVQKFGVELSRGPALGADRAR